NYEFCQISLLCSHKFGISYYKIIEMEVVANVYAARRMMWECRNTCLRLTEETMWPKSWLRELLEDRKAAPAVIDEIMARADEFADSDGDITVMSLLHI